MLHHIATISVCYGGHFESKMTAKIQKSSDLGEIWFPSRLWCCQLISKSTCIVRLGDICNALRYSNQYFYLDVVWFVDGQNHEILKPAISGFVSIPYIGPVFISYENIWRHFTDSKSCQIIESILKYKNGF